MKRRQLPFDAIIRLPMPNQSAFLKLKEPDWYAKGESIGSFPEHPVLPWRHRPGAATLPFDRLMQSYQQELTFC